MSRPSNWIKIGDLRVSDRVLSPDDTIDMGGGVHLPRYFTARPRDCLDTEIVRAMGGRLNRSLNSGLTRATMTLHANTLGDGRHQIYEQWTARDYTAECKRLDLTQAGRKARRALFEHLTPDQVRQVERFNYFDVVLIQPEEVREPGDYLRHLIFRITRGFPNGNIKVLAWKNEFTLCLHPTFPLPTDDICLAQKLMLENEPEAFITTANVSVKKNGRYRHSGHFTRMWDPREVPSPYTPSIEPDQEKIRKAFNLGKLLNDTLDQVERLRTLQEML